MLSIKNNEINELILKIGENSQLINYNYFNYSIMITILISKFNMRW